jgi:hypothetical protein
VAKRDAARPAVAGGDVDKGFVDELHGVSILVTAAKQKALRVTAGLSCVKA